MPPSSVLECPQIKEKLPLAVLPAPRGSSACQEATSVAKTIPLSQGYVTVVDDEDYEWLNQWNWSVTKYVFPNGRVKLRADRTVPTVCADGKTKDVTWLMHRVIVGARDGELVDHVDGDGLNNRRSNLRKATPTQNGQNRKSNRNSSSRYKGVSWNARKEEWIAQIQINKKVAYLGHFADEIEAARAYDRAAKEHFGEFARLNFPNGAA